MSDPLWDKIAIVAQSAGLRVTLDLFFSESNRSTGRYFNRYGEPWRRRLTLSWCPTGPRAAAPPSELSIAKWWPLYGLIKPAVPKAAADAAL